MKQKKCLNKITSDTYRCDILFKKALQNTIDYLNEIKSDLDPKVTKSQFIRDAIKKYIKEVKRL